MYSHWLGDVEIPHPTSGKMKIAGNQIKLSETPVHFDSPAPLLGQHTGEILEEFLGLSLDEIAGLREENVL